MRSVKIMQGVFIALELEVGETEVVEVGCIGCIGIAGPEESLSS